jgi:hypothetical protein
VPWPLPGLRRFLHLGDPSTADGGALVSRRDRQTIELGLALLCHELRLHCGAA